LSEFKTISILITGRVQGVFFRKYTVQNACMLGIGGTVENLPNQQVRIVASGTATQLSQLIEWCHRGSPLSKVLHVSTQQLPYQPFSDFTIKR
jgi:acylphosphatase